MAVRFNVSDQHTVNSPGINVHFMSDTEVWAFYRLTVIHSDLGPVSRFIRGAAGYAGYAEATCDTKHILLLDHFIFIATLYCFDAIFKSPDAPNNPNSTFSEALPRTPLVQLTAHPQTS